MSSPFRVLLSIGYTVYVSLCHPYKALLCHPQLLIKYALHCGQENTFRLFVFRVKVEILVVMCFNIKNKNTHGALTVKVVIA